MNKPASLTALFLAASLLPAPAAAQQQTKQRPTPAQQQDDGDVVRITTNLVQVDAVVTDKDGRIVTDLSPADFEVYEEGKPQPITSFSFVTLARPGDAAPEKTPAQPRPAPRRGEVPPPPAVTGQPRREQVRRTIAVVVDDLHMSFGSVANVRDGLRKFIREQMEPGDLVAIFQTSGGSGALRQFTSDRALLNKAVDAVRWYPTPLGSTSGSVFEPLRDNSTYKPVRAGTGAAPSGAQTFEDERSRQAREAAEDRNEDLVTYGTFGTLSSIVRGFERAPGRKSVVLFSDNLALLSRKGEGTRARFAVERVIDAANRAGATIYTVDARGIVINMISAEDEVGNPSNEIQPGKDDTFAARASQLARSQQGFAVLAEGTGGTWQHDINDMGKALDRALKDQTGYYLLGYRPSDETFKGGSASFRDIKVTVKRPGLRVRYRKGFLAVPDEERRKERGGNSGLYAVLASPVSAGEVYVKMTAGYAAAPAGNSLARLLLHIDGHDVTFRDDKDGWKKLVLDVAAVTLDADGKVVDEFTRTHTVRVPGDAVRVIEANGLTYAADVPVRKPGTYQLRIAVRDDATGRAGSASQIIEVPDLSKHRLSMSAISLREAAPNAAARPDGQATAETALAPVMSPADPAVRRFKPGTVLQFAYQVYNATPDPATRKPRLTAQFRLYQNGELVIDGGAAPVEPEAQSDAARAYVEGAFRVVPNAKPGEYVLQIVVTDTLAKEKAQTSQWITFEVER